ncbi:MAG: D-tyrosyl-tRNA(Tyr) deacylase [Actinomycetia bacterium]|nr:D-tyrosyl-tRNA(Tyr) deacylase [Actinomycetes bacterium]MCP4961841.1 D-tyrosyl-tRNA(Tyr) deacylase [Actinomycetes bacterium]
MRSVLQRVKTASVDVDGECVGEIGPGLCVLVGATHDDTVEVAHKLADRMVNLRIFDDDEGVMNQSLVDVGGSVLVVSQFTLYADTTRGRRPGWGGAAPAAVAEPLVEAVVDRLTDLGVEVATGRFRAEMTVNIENDGPVTIILEA